MWYPPEAKMQVEEERIHIQQPCQFITFTPVGTGLAGITGDMDEAITLQGLHTVIGADLHKLIKYAKSIAPPMKEQVTEAAFITAFNRTANEDGEVIYVLMGVVHTDARLIPAITQIL